MKEEGSRFIGSTAILGVALCLGGCGESERSGEGRGGKGTSGGSGGSGGAELPSFHWVEPIDAHRERAAAATTRAILRTTGGPADAEGSIIIGMSTLMLGDAQELIVTEGMIWTKATGTVALGGLPGVDGDTVGFLSNPSAASSDGSVVVGTAPTSTGNAAFRWTRADGMEKIADDADPTDVSADGSVVVGHDASLARVFRWTRQTGAVPIEPLAGDYQSYPLYMSSDGDTILGTFSGAGGDRLFRYTAAGATEAIELPVGFTACRIMLPAKAISYGVVVGGSCVNESGETEAVVWAEGASMIGLGTLAGLSITEPSAVSADGSIAVGMAETATGAGRPFRWTEASGIELIELPAGYEGGAPASRRSGMSEDGSVVVGTMSGTAGRAAFRWAEGSGVTALSPLEGHDRADAYAVSRDGSIAAGSSYRLGPADEPEDLTAVFWRTDGVPHRVTDELAAAGLELGGGALGAVLSVHSPFGFVGSGAQDADRYYIMWRARFP